MEPSLIHNFLYRVLCEVILIIAKTKHEQLKSDFVDPVNYVTVRWTTSGNSLR